MSNIVLTGEAWREAGEWKFTVKGPSWVVDEIVKNGNAGQLQISGEKAAEADYTVMTCQTAKKGVAE